MRWFGRLLGRRSFSPGGDYLADYRRHTDARVRRDPKSAIGGMWDEIGKLQIDFLVSEGLKPSHTLLDIGSGTLRGGRHFIRYLNEGNYTGTEMSGEAIEAARKLVEREALSDKHPTLIHVSDGNLRFDGLPTFDFVLAQSVFTHLPKPLIEECFANIGKIMGRFYFTFLDPRLHTDTAKDFAYPFDYFAELGERNGLAVENVSGRYPHPRGQKMALATR